MTTTDERRARAILAACDLGIEWEHASSGLRHSCLHSARAIRASDEVTGMVLVPREATEEMIDVGAQECAADHESYRTMARETWEAMLAAATESDNG